MSQIQAWEALAALEQILGSDVFLSSPRSRDFLAFVVTQAVEGREGRIKEATVAKYALGRSWLDPGDPAVRVQASRVRKALDLYYEGQGRFDAVRIRLPKGTYVPEFIRVGSRIRKDMEVGILVARFTPLDDPVAASMSESLVHVLSAFPAVRVGGPVVVGDEPGAALAYDMRFVLTGSVRTSGQVLRINTRLLDVNSGEVVWSLSTDREIGAVGGFTGEDDLVHVIAGSVGDHQGVARRRGSRDPQAFSAMTAYYEFLDVPDQAHVDAAVVALEAVSDVGDPLVDAALSVLLANRALMPFGDQPEADQRRAQALGERALAQDPGLALGWVALAVVALSRGQLDLCQAQARRAVQLCARHPSTLYTAGMLLAIAGAWDEGIVAIREANRLNPLHGWHQHILLALDAVLAGDYAQALVEVSHGSHPQEARGALVRTLSLWRLGFPDQAAEEFEVALSAEPTLLDDDAIFIINGYPDTPLHVREGLRALVLEYVAARSSGG